VLGRVRSWGGLLTFASAIAVMCNAQVQVPERDASGALGPPVVLAQSSAFAVTISLPQPRVSGATSPWVYVTVRNFTPNEIPFPQERLYVQGKAGEAETTLLERQFTHTLRANEPELPEGGYRPMIEPGGTLTRKLEISKFYKLRPGTYSVYVDCLDTFGPKHGGPWVRSGGVQLQVLP
jgi:hypothetical protein